MADKKGGEERYPYNSTKFNRWLKKMKTEMYNGKKLKGVTFLKAEYCHSKKKTGWKCSLCDNSLRFVFKKHILVTHCKGTTHESEVLRDLAQREARRLFTGPVVAESSQEKTEREILDKKLAKIDGKALNVLSKLFLIAFTVAFKGLSIENYTEFCDLYANLNSQPFTETKYHSAKFGKKFISYIAKIIRRQTVESIKKSEFWATVFDATTDKKIAKKLIVYVAYWKENPKTEVKEKKVSLFKLVTLKSGDADSQTKVLTDLFNKESLDWTCFIGGSTDGESTNVGRWNGICKQLSEKSVLAQWFTCICHSCVLGFRCIESIKPFSTALSVYQKLQKFFKYGSRSKFLKDNASKFSSYTLIAFKRIVGPRWILARALIQFLKSGSLFIVVYTLRKIYASPEFRDNFPLKKDRRRVKFLLKSLCSFDIIFSFFWLMDVSESYELTIKNFQSADVNIVSIRTDLRVLKSKMNQMKLLYDSSDHLISYLPDTYFAHHMNTHVATESREVVVGNDEEEEGEDDEDEVVVVKVDYFLKYQKRGIDSFQKLKIGGGVKKFVMSTDRALDDMEDEIVTRFKAITDNKLYLMFAVFVPDLILTLSKIEDDVHSIVDSSNWEWLEKHFVAIEEFLTKERLDALKIKIHELKKEIHDDCLIVVANRFLFLKMSHLKFLHYLEQNKKEVFPSYLKFGRYIWLWIFENCFAERGFSHLKIICTEKRLSLVDQTVEDLMMIKCSELNQNEFILNVLQPALKEFLVKENFQIKSLNDCTANYQLPEASNLRFPFNCVRGDILKHWIRNKKTPKYTKK